jgi:hypothetical protein
MAPINPVDFCNCKETAMKKLVVPVILCLSTGLVMAQAAFFYSANASIDSTGDLIVKWDERGLGNGGTPITYTITGDSTALYACITKSNQHPQATNKEGPTALGVTTEPIAPKGGRVVYTKTIEPLPNQGLTCPSGQTLVLACVSYTNLVLTDTVNNSSVPLGSVSGPVTPVKGISCN